MTVTLLRYTLRPMKTTPTAVIADEEWGTEALAAEYRGSNTLLVRKSQLQACFSVKGEQTDAVEFSVTGDHVRVQKVFAEHALTLTPDGQPEAGHPMRPLILRAAIPLVLQFHKFH